MLHSQVKKDIAQEIQVLLRSIVDSELPEGEINFILHIDGKEDWSWANIRNDSHKNVPVPDILVQNLSIVRLNQ